MIIEAYLPSFARFCGGSGWERVMKSEGKDQRGFKRIKVM